jgi:thioredoxin reductase (NADPH)
VRYFVSDQSDFADQRVAVLGGGDSAIDMALMLEPIAKEVHLIHRRDAFRALEHTVSQLKKSQVQVETPYLPKELQVNEDDSIDLTLKKMRSDEEKHLAVDKILVNYGFTSNNAALNEWELPLASERGLIKVDSKMETSVPGVYAIGDGVTYPGKAALIAVGFGEAPIAITALAKALYPQKRMATHSSSMHIDSRHK